MVQDVEDDGEEKERIVEEYKQLVFYKVTGDEVRTYNFDTKQEAAYILQHASEYTYSRLYH